MESKDIPWKTESTTELDWSLFFGCFYTGKVESKFPCRPEIFPSTSTLSIIATLKVFVNNIRITILVPCQSFVRRVDVSLPIFLEASSALGLLECITSGRRFYSKRCRICLFSPSLHRTAYFLLLPYLFFFFFIAVDELTTQVPPNQLIQCGLIEVNLPALPNHHTHPSSVPCHIMSTSSNANI